MEIKKVLSVEDTDEVKRLKRENEFLLTALVEIEETLDHYIGQDDLLAELQQISVGIKGLRNLIGTAKIMDLTIKSGLVRE